MLPADFFWLQILWIGIATVPMVQGDDRTPYLKSVSSSFDCCSQSELPLESDVQTFLRLPFSGTDTLHLHSEQYKSVSEQLQPRYYTASF